MTGREYICAACGGRFEKGWSDEEAEAEYLENPVFAAMEQNNEPRRVVCDDCYKKMVKS